MRLYASDGAIDGAPSCGEMIHRGSELGTTEDLLNQSFFTHLGPTHFFQSQTFCFNTVGRFFSSDHHYKILQVCIKTRHELGEGRNDLIICLVQRVFHQYEWLHEGKWTYSGWDGWNRPILTIPLTTPHKTVTWKCLGKEKKANAVTRAHVYAINQLKRKFMKGTLP